MKITDFPMTARVRPDFGMPTSFGVLGADRGTAVHISGLTAARTAVQAGFRRTHAAAGIAAAPLRTWSPPLT